MKNSNKETVDLFFAAYAERDRAAVKEVMHENAPWHFFG